MRNRYRTSFLRRPRGSHIHCVLSSNLDPPRRIMGGRLKPAIAGRTRKTGNSPDIQDQLSRARSSGEEVDLFRLDERPHLHRWVASFLPLQLGRLCSIRFPIRCCVWLARSGDERLRGS